MSPSNGPGALELHALEARVARKLRARILPFTMLLYLVSFLDRVNVGFAAFTMNKAIGLTPAMFGFGGGIFFLGYILFQVPANLFMLRSSSLMRSSGACLSIGESGVGPPAAGAATAAGCFMTDS